MNLGPPDLPSPAGANVWDEPAITGVASTEEIQHPSQVLALEPALTGMMPRSLPTYGAVYRRRRAATPISNRWAAAGAALMVGGPLAVLGALVGQMVGAPSAAFALVAVVVLGPALEEVLKASGALYLAEQRPWLVPAGWTLVVATIGAGLVFAALENFLYLEVYISNPSEALVHWRWLAGPLLHGTASGISGFGIARMWWATDRNGVPPQLRLATPWIIAAAALHGLYNGLVVLLESTLLRLT